MIYIETQFCPFTPYELIGLRFAHCGWVD